MLFKKIFWFARRIEYFLDTHNEPYFSIIKSNQAEFNGGTYWPFNEDFYLIFNVASGGTNGGDPIQNRFCQNIECSNKDDKDKGRLLIDYIEIKSID